MAGTRKKESNPGKSDAASLREVLESIAWLVAEDAGSPRYALGSRVLTDRDVDRLAFDAMDVISGSIEKHNDRWSLALDAVESDLQAMLSADCRRAPSAA